MEPRTHLKSSPRWVGEVIELTEDEARVSLRTDDEMAVDENGLIHGGFVFSLADYAAMLAVNDPNVVLGGAEVRFTRPVKAGDQVEAVARQVAEDGRKRIVEVEATRLPRGDGADGGEGEAPDQGEVVLRGVFTCYVLRAHVLELY